MSYLREFPGANMQDIWFGANLETPPLYFEIARLTYRCKSQLTHKDREMMGGFSMSLLNCPEPQGVHTRNFTFAGGERWLIPDLVRDPTFMSVEEKYRPLLVLIRKSLERADSVNKADVDACYDAGWNGHTVQIVSALTAFSSQLALWINMLGMRYDEEEIIESSNNITTGGYGENDGPCLTDEQYKEKYPDYLDTNFKIS